MEKELNQSEDVPLFTSFDPPTFKPSDTNLQQLESSNRPSSLDVFCSIQNESVSNKFITSLPAFTTCEIQPSQPPLFPTHHLSDDKDHENVYSDNNKKEAESPSINDKQIRSNTHAYREQQSSTENDEDDDELTEWEQNCIEDFENELVPDSTYLDTVEAYKQEIKVYFDKVCEEIHVMHSENNNVHAEKWEQYQRAASSATLMYKQSLESRRKCNEIGNKQGIHSKTKDLIDWLKMQPKHIPRKDLISFISGCEQRKRYASRQRNYPEPNMTVLSEFDASLSIDDNRKKRRIKSSSNLGDPWHPGANFSLTKPEPFSSELRFDNTLKELNQENQHKFLARSPMKVLQDSPKKLFGDRLLWHPGANFTMTTYDLQSANFKYSENILNDSETGSAELCEASTEFCKGGPTEFLEGSSKDSYDGNPEESYECGPIELHKSNSKESFESELNESCKYSLNEFIENRTERFHGYKPNEFTKGRFPWYPRTNFTVTDQDLSSSNLKYSEEENYTMPKGDLLHSNFKFSKDIMKESSEKGLKEFLECIPDTFIKDGQEKFTGNSERENIREANFTMSKQDLLHSNFKFSKDIIKESPEKGLKEFFVSSPDEIIKDDQEKFTENSERENIRGGHGLQDLPWHPGANFTMTKRDLLSSDFKYSENVLNEVTDERPKEFLIGCPKQFPEGCPKEFLEDNPKELFGFIPKEFDNGSIEEFVDSNSKKYCEVESAEFLEGCAWSNRNNEYSMNDYFEENLTEFGECNRKQFLEHSPNEYYGAHSGSPKRFFEDYGDDFFEDNQNEFDETTSNYSRDDSSKESYEDNPELFKSLVDSQDLKMFHAALASSNPNYLSTSDTNPHDLSKFFAREVVRQRKRRHSSSEDETDFQDSSSHKRHRYF